MQDAGLQVGGMATGEGQGDLPPPGSRCGTGVHSVLPYLTKILQVRPGSGSEARAGRPRQGNPVFSDWNVRPRG